MTFSSADNVCSRRAANGGGNVIVDDALRLCDELLTGELQTQETHDIKHKINTPIQQCI
jgi:hypothetical protein